MKNDEGFSKRLDKHWGFGFWQGNVIPFQSSYLEKFKTPVNRGFFCLKLSQKPIRYCLWNSWSEYSFRYFFLTSAVNAAELNCGTFSGEWNGNKKGAGYKGDLKIVFDDNCKYDIFKKNGKILTPGKIKIKKGTKVTYKNKAGSRGKVTLEGDTLTWKNVYTGNNYKIIVNKN